MENNDKWLKSLGEKVEGFEMREPDGLWTAIEGRIDVRDSARRRGGVLLWMRRAVAVAASVAVVALFAWMFTSDELPAMPDMAGNANGQEPAVQKHDTRPVDVLAEVVPLQSTSQNKQSVTPSVIQEVEPVVKNDIVSIEETPECTADDIVSDKDRETVRESGRSSVTEPSGQDSDLPVMELPRRYDSRLALAVFTSGSLGSSAGNSGRIDRFAPLRNMVADDYVADQPLVRSRSVNAFDSRNFDMRHHLPVRVGVKVSFGLLRNLAVETGIAYSRHSSDFSYDGSFNSATGEQKLNYIGIPLGVQLGITRWNRFRVYASAGVLGEKLLSGTMSGVVSNTAGNMIPKRESLHEKALQWSLNASAGLQYDITDVVGLYVEPGVGYHFDNGSSIRNIYKDRSVDFNLNVGFRFSINRH